MPTFTTRRRGVAKPLTTAQRLDRIIKSARQIMRKDKGLNGDLDRLPMLTWIMFLKFLDDMERIEETRAGLAGRTWRPVVEAPWRWRDWAAPADGITGADLLSFLSSDETMLPDGSRGPGLFAYLRGLRGDDGRRDRRDVVATVFRGFSNRMESGYLLRDVVSLVDGIRFDSSEEIHVLGRLYETLLREMRDAAGDSGEFYTPRPVVRFMVEALAPKLGETVLDPACGTGGFLVESFTHLEKQADTVEKRAILQDASILGGEAKSLPFLLAQMNLLLHGVEAPRIDPDNSLRFRLAEIGEAERVDVIMTNPPFGGEEERGILSNFPRGPPHRGDRAPVPAAHHAPPQARRPRPRSGRSPERHAVRRRRVRPHQGRPAPALQRAHHRAPAGGRIRPLHRHPDEPDILRHDRPHPNDLVLRATPPGGPQEVLQDGTAPVRGVRRLPRLVAQSRRERARLEGGRHSAVAARCQWPCDRLQSR